MADTTAVKNDLSRQLRLRILYPNGEKFLELNKPITTIGRDESCDLRIQDGKTSRIHCEIIRETDFYVLMDRHSTNGTFVNEARVVHHVLEAGDLLQIGNTRIMVEHFTPKFSEGFENSDQFKSEVHSLLPVKSAERYLRRMARDPADPPQESTSKKNQPPEEGGDNAAAAAILDVFEGDNRPVRELERDSRELMRELRILYRVADKVNRLNSQEALYDYICDTVFNVFEHVEYLTLAVRLEDASENALNYNPVRSLNRESREFNSMFAISRSLVQQAIETKSGVLASDAPSDARFDKSASIPRLKIKSVMCVPLLSGGQDIGILYVDNRSKPFCFDQNDLELFTTIAQQFAAALDKVQMRNRLNRTFHETLLALINTLEAKDNYTMGHTQRVCQYALGIARQMNLSSERCSRLQTAAMLHDIGKIGTRHRILNKPGALTNTEFSHVKDHVEVGCYILKPIDYLKDVLPIIRSHHEKWDGTGYPDGLKGEEIPLEGRILCLADALDAMTSKRSYSEAMSKEEAVRRVREGANTHFDPQVVAAFEEYISNYDLISSDKTFIQTKDLIRQDPNEDSLIIEVQQDSQAAGEALQNSPAAGEAAEIDEV